MTEYLGNALSLGMLDCLAEHPVRLLCRQITLDAAHEWVRAHSPASCVGHADTAELLSAMLDIMVPLRRVSTSLGLGDRILVAQYNGPRLAPGARTLPEGARIRWILVEVSE